MDMGAYQAAAKLLDELTSRLTETRAGQVKAAAVHPGGDVPAYGCDAAFVRIGSIYPTDPFPAPLGVPLHVRKAIVWAVTLEMVVDRCYINTEDNSMPYPAELDSLARDAADDAAAMRAAARCAFGSDQVVPGVWMPRGPAGGIHGGVMTVVVPVELDCGCGSLLPQLDSRIAPLPGDPRH